jgi:hypothetical protein
VSCVEVEIKVDNRGPDPATLDHCAISAVIMVLSTGFRKEKWRAVGAFLAGPVPRDRWRITICANQREIARTPHGVLYAGKTATDQ